jgi:hypothetical protein
VETDMPIDDLRNSPMMSHLLDSMDRGEDIGHYGRLVFVMVGRHFLSHDELVDHLTKDKDCDAEKAEVLIKQVESRGYNPPKPERILEWMDKQDFAICDPTEGGEACNVYRTLDFPPEVYEKIAAYYENRQ